MKSKFPLYSYDSFHRTARTSTTLQLMYFYYFDYNYFDQNALQDTSVFIGLLLSTGVVPDWTDRET